MIADDLFAGAGGWDLAAAELGIHARGIENMPEARATRDAAGLTTIHDDVWTFQPDGNATGLIASPPCQSFSQAGKGKGRQALDNVLAEIDSGAYLHLEWLRSLGTEYGDERTALVLAPLHFALSGGYEWLAWEQVPTVLPVWEACANVLRSHGWNVWTGKLRAEQYGVPQTRIRAFLIATRTTDVAPPQPTHSRYYSTDPQRLDNGVAKWVSMAEALGWGLSERPSPTITGGGTDAGGAEPIAKWDRYVNRPDFLRMTKMANSAQRTPDQPAPTICFGHDAASARWFTPVFCGAGATSEVTAGQIPRTLDEPAHTITGSGTAAWRIGDPRAEYETRRITVQEAGILQSFPTDYPWAGKQGKQFLQAGNAVPPGMALHALAAASGRAIEAEAVA